MNASGGGEGGEDGEGGEGGLYIGARRSAYEKMDEMSERLFSKRDSCKQR
jgi:hypothetical protein